MMRSRGAPMLVRRGIAIALLTLLVLAALNAGGLFSLPDLKLRDIWFRLRGERRASDMIALVEIDDETVSAYGGWPLSRDVYALLLVALQEADARAVGLDLLFLGPDQYDPRHDALLASVSAANPGIVHAVAFLSEAPVGGGGPSSAEGVNLLVSRHGLDVDLPVVPCAAGASIPFESLVASAHAMGHTALSVDDDGIIRRLPPFVRYRSGVYPALALRLAWLGIDGGGVPAVTGTESKVIMSWEDGRRIELPIDDEGSAPINFCGGPEAFPNRHGMLKVLRLYSDGNLDALRDAFSGKIVIVGNTAVGEALADLGATPFTTLIPLVYAHAGFLDMMLRGCFFRFVPAWLSILPLAGVAVLLGWLFARLSLPAAAVLMAGAVVALAALEFGLFAFARLVVPNAMPLILAPAAYGAIATYRDIFMERRVREHEKELRVARTIQMELLPSGPPSVAGLDVFGVNIPAKDVAGDYFDWIVLSDGTLAVALGDVSGKGVSSSLLMSHLRASLHAEARGSHDAREIVGAMNVSLSRAIEAHHFATFFLAVISTGSHSVTYCNAGQSPVLLVSAGEVRPLMPTGVPLGVFEDSSYASKSVDFRPGDYLVLCSDGVTESGRGDELYGDERLRFLVASIASRNLTALEAGEAILAGVRSFTGRDEYDDDVTVVIVRRH